MLANTHAKENGSRTLPRKPTVFLAHTSPPSRKATDSDLNNLALVGDVEIVGCVRGKDSIDRGSISVLRSNTPDFSTLGAPKL
jgi:hypothetical protein